MVVESPGRADRPLQISAGWAAVLVFVAGAGIGGVWSAQTRISALEAAVADLKADGKRQTAEAAQFATAVQEAREKAEGVSTEKEGQFNTVQIEINKNQEVAFENLCTLWIKTYAGECPWKPTYWPDFKK
jgi:hypothetical protein